MAISTLSAVKIFVDFPDVYAGAHHNDGPVPSLSAPGCTICLGVQCLHPHLYITQGEAGHREWRIAGTQECRNVQTQEVRQGRRYVQV